MEQVYPNNAPNEIGSGALDGGGVLPGQRVQVDRRRRLGGAAVVVRQRA